MLKRSVLFSIVAIGMMTSASIFAVTLSHGDKKFLDEAAHAGREENRQLVLVERPLQRDTGVVWAPCIDGCHE